MMLQIGRHIVEQGFMVFWLDVLFNIRGHWILLDCTWIAPTWAIWSSGRTFKRGYRAEIRSMWGFLGFGAQGSGFGTWGLGFRVQGLRNYVSVLGFTLFGALGVGLGD